MKPRIAAGLLLLLLVMTAGGGGSSGGGGSVIAAEAARPAPKADFRRQHSRSSGRPPAPARAPAELSNSFMITSFQDLEPQMINGRLTTPCEFAVARARAIGGKFFSIVPTAYWDGDARHVAGYGFKDVSDAFPGGVGFARPDARSLARWKKGLQGCFRAAVKAGFEGIQVLNHIDAKDGRTWRNLVDLDPLARYGGYTYEDVVVRPVADALRTVTRPSTKVWFMVAGEMGRSLFHYPRSYWTLVNKYKQGLARGRVGTNVKVGLALHWNKVCGDCFPMPYTKTAEAYNATFGRAFAQHRSRIVGGMDLASLRRALDACDVLGLSHYAPMPVVHLTPASFEMPFWTAAYELRYFGVDLRRLVARSGRAFLYSEVGLGGADPDHTTTAKSLADLARNVHDGIWAVYNARQDPWRRPDFRDYRRRWFYTLLSFLHSGGSRDVRVAGAFLWSVGSFDVAAVHPISSSHEGSYADPAIIGWMTRLSSAAAAT